MKLGFVVDWESDVLAAWTRSADGRVLPDKDIWSCLPEGVCWFKGNIEAQDMPNMYVIGTEGWYRAFGTHRLLDIVRPSRILRHDSHQMQRVRRMMDSLHEEWVPEPIIMVASAASGPFVIIDGNHRTLALQFTNSLVQQPCYVGFHLKISTDFIWYREADVDISR